MGGLRGIPTAGALVGALVAIAACGGTKTTPTAASPATPAASSPSPPESSPPR